MARVILNVGGVRHEVLWESINKYPETRLGQLQKCPLENCDGVDNNEFYFNRHYKSFSSILNFYITGKLHFENGMCVNTFLEDLKYWGIDKDLLEPCCSNQISQENEELNLESEEITIERNVWNGKILADWREPIWNMLEKPNSCWKAKLIGLFMVFLISLSTIGIVLNSMPDLQEYECMSEDKTICNLEALNYTGAHHLSSPSTDWIPVENYNLKCLGNIITVAFTIEFIIRFVVCPNKVIFATQILNYIDLLAILPHIALILIVSPHHSHYNGLLNLGRTFRVFRVFRMVSILEKMWNSRGVTCIGLTLRKSSQELFYIVFLLLASMVIFATLAYYAEREENPLFESIPVSFWWALITMTTVGYGDMYPITSLGKRVATACCIWGVLLVIAMPIPILVNNFRLAWNDEIKNENRERKQRGTKEGIYTEVRNGADSAGIL